jgi:hypothetical protein
MPPIFLSYRREDTEGEAGGLSDLLVNHYGRDAVFLDVEAIQPGEDLRLAIEKAVGSCGVPLAIIGKNWIGLRDQSGDRRLDHPDDFVRLEIGAALKREMRVPVVPVLVHGTRMPQANQLPEDLKGLVYPLPSN